MRPLLESAAGSGVERHPPVAVSALHGRGGSGTGESAVGMYDALASKYPSASPQQRGSTVYQVWLGAGTAQAVGDIIGATGASVGAVATGVATGIPSWEGAIGTFLGDLSSASTWIRVAKVLVGGAMLLVGIAKLTGAPGIAAKAVKIAPLL